LSKEGVSWRYDGQKEYNFIKKWTKVPFHIEDEPIFGADGIAVKE